ncbi:hypothetical protein GCM10011498_38630 [Amylibacter cionae]|uniref:Uncharacterized protein n=1 Tax=Neptunicoccus cionae TaxID=2035344 RepID=A0A916R4K8_9RHOB|nr:hypothetical protein GCM10011498_38630 [Amylibacter cionae]
MLAQLSIVEKIVGQTQRQAFSLRLASERISARDVVAKHVRDEVDRLNDLARRRHVEHDRVASFLVGDHSHELERKLNKPNRKGPKALDPTKEIEAALDAIESRRVIVLFDDFEVEDFDADLTVTDQSKITFLRLVPLVGG